MLRALFLFPDKEAESRRSTADIQFQKEASMAETFHTPFGDIDPAAADAATAAAAAADSRRNIEEISIKFAKGLCSEPFMSKSGKESGGGSGKGLSRT